MDYAVVLMWLLWCTRILLNKLGQHSLYTALLICICTVSVSQKKKSVQIICQSYKQLKIRSSYGKCKSLTIGITYYITLNNKQYLRGKLDNPGWQIWMGRNVTLVSLLICSMYYESPWPKPFRACYSDITLILYIWIALYVQRQAWILFNDACASSW